MAKVKPKLDRVLDDIHQLEDFLHALIPTLNEQNLRQGDDVLRYAKDLKLKIPDSLRGLDVTWETDHFHSHLKHGRESIALVRPGHSGAVGLVIKCVKIGKWKFCLECGFLWCRIVVTRRF